MPRYDIPRVPIEIFDSTSSPLFLVPRMDLLRLKNFESISNLIDELNKIPSANFVANNQIVIQIINIK
jgi:hypothetical protein